MKKPQVIHLGPEIPLCSARCRRDFELRVLADGTVPAGFAGGDIAALIAAAPVPAAVIAALPALRTIAVYGVGYDKVDLAAARARGIAVTNTPGPTDGCVADMGFALLLAAARGSIIDEPALVAALRDGIIAAAGLDVFDHESTVPAELMALDNVVLMPHRGGGTIETWEECADLVIANLRAHFAGQPLPTPIPAN